MIQLCGCFARASSHCSTVASVGGSKAGTRIRSVGVHSEDMHDRGIKAESETVGHSLGSGFRSVTDVPVKVGLGVKFIEGAYARSNDNTPCLEGSRTMAEGGERGLSRSGCASAEERASGYRPIPARALSELRTQVNGHQDTTTPRP